MRISTDKNYYKILGVARNATADAIKKKFRKLAKEHHPDTNAGNKKSEDKFKIISEAYEILGDEKKRQAYDRQTPQGQPRRARTSSRRRRSQRDEKSRYGYGFSESGKRTEYREPFTESEFQEEASIDPDFPTRGIDLQYMIDVPLVTAALGGKLPLAYEKFVNCGDCRGFGTENGLDCPACQGKGQTVGQLSLDIDIPPGIMDQYTLRLENRGGEGRNGGPPGDMLVKVCIQPHPHFKRVKTDIYAEVAISPQLAEEGGPLKVQTLDSIQTIQVEEGTLTGEDYRIIGAGASVPWGKKRGDFIVKFAVADPT